MNQAHRIPVILLTGFLGSGKTTLLNALLRDPAMAGTAVLINEVGAVGLDHLFVQQVAEDITLLESGCLCCAVRGDLVRALRDLFMRRLRRELQALDRVVIETSGMADSAPVIHTLMRDFFLAERFVLQAVVTVVDVRNVHWQLAHEEAVRQIVLADHIVLSKCDLADRDGIEAAELAVHALNPGVLLGQSSPDVAPADSFLSSGIFDPSRRGEDALRWLGEAAVQAQLRLKEAGSVSGAPRPALVGHASNVSTHVLQFEKPVDWVAFSSALDMLLSVMGDAVLRFKALLAVEGEAAPRMLHAVRHERYPPQWLDAWPDADHTSRLVFIVDDLPRSVLERAFAAFLSSSAAT